LFVCSHFVYEVTLKRHSRRERGSQSDRQAGDKVTARCRCLQLSQAAERSRKLTARPTGGGKKSFPRTRYRTHFGKPLG